MRNVLAIDPGYAAKGDGCACAYFDDGNLIEVWFERPAFFRPGEIIGHAAGRGRWLTNRHRPGPAYVIVVERPVVQGSRTRGANPGNLMDLSWAGGMLAGMFAGRDGVPIVAWPSSDADGIRGWKGPESKPANHHRLWQILTRAERALLGGDATERAIEAACEKGALCRWSKPGDKLYPASFKTHNKLDACAMGATYLGRLKRTA